MIGSTFDPSMVKPETNVNSNTLAVTQPTKEGGTQTVTREGNVTVRDDKGQVIERFNTSNASEYIAQAKKNTNAIRVKQNFERNFEKSLIMSDEAKAETRKRLAFEKSPGVVKQSVFISKLLDSKIVKNKDKDVVNLSDSKVIIGDIPSVGQSKTPAEIESIKLAEEKKLDDDILFSEFSVFGFDVDDVINYVQNDTFRRELNLKILYPEKKSFKDFVSDIDVMRSKLDKPEPVVTLNDFKSSVKDVSSNVFSLGVGIATNIIKNPAGFAIESVLLKKGLKFVKAADDLAAYNTVSSKSIAKPFYWLDDVNINRKYVFNPKNSFSVVETKSGAVLPTKQTQLYPKYLIDDVASVSPRSVLPGVQSELPGRIFRNINIINSERAALRFAEYKSNLKLSFPTNKNYNFNPKFTTSAVDSSGNIIGSQVQLSPLSKSYIPNKYLLPIDSTSIQKTFPNKFDLRITESGKTLLTEYNPGDVLRAERVAQEGYVKVVNDLSVQKTLLSVDPVITYKSVGSEFKIFSYGGETGKKSFFSIGKKGSASFGFSQSKFKADVSYLDDVSSSSNSFSKGMLKDAVENNLVIKNKYLDFLDEVGSNRFSNSNLGVAKENFFLNDVPLKFTNPIAFFRFDNKIVFNSKIDSLNNVDFDSVNDVKDSSLVDLDLNNDVAVKQVQILRTEQDIIQSQSSSQKQSQRQSQDNVLVVKQVVDDTFKEVVVPESFKSELVDDVDVVKDNKVFVRYWNNPSPIPPVSEVVNPIVDDFNFPNGKRVNNSFSVFVREKGFFKLKRSGLSKSEAFGFGSRYVGGSSAASFKVLDSDKDVVDTDDYIKGFRRSKSEKGVLVELSKFRINTVREKEQITFKGLLSLKNRKGDINGFF